MLFVHQRSATPFIPEHVQSDCGFIFYTQTSLLL